jgi:phytoene dehydrogenase-like protein
VRHDAIVVGSGPNGLAAAITLAQAGLSVLVREAASMPGGGARSEALTLPGFLHDVCSAVHPLGVASPLFRRLPLADHGLEWIQPSAAMAHPFDDGTVALLERSTAATGEWLGPDAAAYRALMDPFVTRWEQLYSEVLGPPLHLPRHPLLLANFGLRALLPTSWLVRRFFRGPKARALFAGIAAHETLPLGQSPSSAFGLVLGVAGHAVGWPLARGGSGSITRALVSYLRSLGGELVTDAPVESLDDLPQARAVLLDLTPRQILRIAGPWLPSRYRRQLQQFRYGLGTFKVDWALDGPIPWRAPDCGRAATVHLGGSLEEIEAERETAWAGRTPERPFVLLVQPSLFDNSRAPAGQQTAWAYCHPPNGSPANMTEKIEAQIERFAPGFRDRIIARHTMGPGALERHNPNLVGGDISGGEATLSQLLFRPVPCLVPYTTPLRHVFICSSSTPPGGGVHGMCGYYAARAALSRCF